MQMLSNAELETSADFAMATKTKGKRNKEVEKKSAEKQEETVVTEEKKEENAQNGVEVETKGLPTETEKIPAEEKEVIVEVNNGPSLIETIIETFDGEKVDGIFEGEGVIHFRGDHVYAGMFSHGLMHGKGCYTWNDGIVYKGDFFNNKITGSGSYQWPDGSSYEGEVLNGKRHGVGVYKCKNNTMLYSGEWFFGKKHGKGKMEYNSEVNSFYDGDWIENVRHGWGVRRYPSGNMYEGMWFNSVRHGEGTMKWQDPNGETKQVYSGQWQDGIQHGNGHYIWIIKRIPGSQYALRNSYEGEFVLGKRHGYGIFYYANGAKYEGLWENDMKHGEGKFTLKNGRIYEGLFQKDHMAEFPDFEMDGISTPDISQIRTQTPLENVSVHSNASINTSTPNFQLNIEQLLKKFTELAKEEEIKQVTNVVTRHMTKLKKIYTFYSCLGCEDSPDNIFILSRMQFWRFLKDCQFHYEGFSLMQMDRILADYHNQSTGNLHDPYKKILQRDFISYLILLAFHMYKAQHKKCQAVLAWCLDKLFTNNLLPFACKVRGKFFYEVRRAENALEHMDQTYQIYLSLCTPRKCASRDLSFKTREFLFLIKDLKLLNDNLTPKAVIEILSQNDPNIHDKDKFYNLEVEMTFLEFIEALVGCAEIYVTEEVAKESSTATERCVYADADGISSTNEYITQSKWSSTVTSIPNVSEKISTGKVHADNITGATEISAEDKQFEELPGEEEAEQQPKAEEAEIELEVLDKETQQFNFWTHQVHIFFLRKFIPKAIKLIAVRQLVEKRNKIEEKQRIHLLHHAKIEKMVEEYMLIEKAMETEANDKDEAEKEIKKIEETKGGEIVVKKKHEHVRRSSKTPFKTLKHK